MSRGHPFTDVTFEDVIQFDKRTLNAVMDHGATPQREHLADWEFKGFNPPAFAKVLGFQKFVKGFFVDDAGNLAGYNLFVENPRSGPKAAWRPKKDGAPETRHGFYDVVPVGANPRYDDYPNAVLLDYGSGRNKRIDPEGRIRDFLVQVDPTNPDLYLGKAFLDLGFGRVFSNFFVLERLRPAPKS